MDKTIFVPGTRGGPPSTQPLPPMLVSATVNAAAVCHRHSHCCPHHCLLPPPPPPPLFPPLLLPLFGWLLSVDPLPGGYPPPLLPCLSRHLMMSFSHHHGHRWACRSCPRDKTRTMERDYDCHSRYSVFVLIERDWPSRRDSSRHLWMDNLKPLDFSKRRDENHSRFHTGVVLRDMIQWIYFYSIIICSQKINGKWETHNRRGSSLISYKMLLISTIAR